MELNMKKLYALCFLLYAFCASVYAADFFAPRVVTVIPSDGECVGKTDDPLCVFDTVIACAIRAKPELCAAVGFEYDNFFRNAMADLVGKDYKYNPVEMYVNRRKPACAHDDDKACATNPATGEIVAVDMSIKDNNNTAVYLRREKNGHWSVIFATQYSCWADEDCS